MVRAERESDRAGSVSTFESSLDELISLSSQEDKEIWWIHLGLNDAVTLSPSRPGGRQVPIVILNLTTLLYRLKSCPTIPLTED